MIDVVSIGKQFEGRWVFRDLSITVQPGDLVGIIGPSGSGKTTLLKCMNGLLRIDEGTIAVDDAVLAPTVNNSRKDSVVVRRQVGMVFQHLNLWPYWTALENMVAAVIHVRKMDRSEAIERAVAWARRLGVEDQLHKYPAKLSGGQRQRVAIARAVMMEPEFLLLDEITSALDPILAGEIVDTMVELKEGGMGIVFVSHQIDFIRQNANKVYFLDGGRFREQGRPQEVLASPNTPELRHFIEAIRHGL
jgi:ABC-type polar amino acid transport system ATPase subunit